MEEPGVITAEVYNTTSINDVPSKIGERLAELENGITKQPMANIGEDRAIENEIVHATLAIKNIREENIGNDSKIIKYSNKITTLSSLSSSIWNCNESCYGIDSLTSNNANLTVGSTSGGLILMNNNKKIEEDYNMILIQQDDNNGSLILDWDKIWKMETLDIMKLINCNTAIVTNSKLIGSLSTGGNILHLICARCIVENENNRNYSNNKYYCYTNNKNCKITVEQNDKNSTNKFDLLERVNNLHDIIQRIIQINPNVALEQDDNGDLPLHLFVRYFWNWHSPEQKKNKKRLKSIAKLIRECVLFLLDVVVEYLTEDTASSGGSVGVLLPIHIASMYGTSFQTLDNLLVVYPQGAAVLCDGALRNLEPSYPLQLFENRRKNNSKESTGSFKDDDDEDHNSDILEYFNRRSDHIFCFYPPIQPYCNEQSRIKRVEYLIRTEATVYNIPLSYAAEAMWIWLCTCNEDNENHAQVVSNIITGLNVASFSKLNAIQTSNGHNVITIATKECVAVLRSYSLELAKSQLDNISLANSSSMPSTANNGTTNNSVTSIMKASKDIKVIIPNKNTKESSSPASSPAALTKPANNDDENQEKLKYIQMNIIPFLHRIFGIQTNESLQPTTFIILPYKLILNPITKNTQLFNPIDDAQLAIDFATKLVLLLQENSKITFYLLLEKIIMQQQTNIKEEEEDDDVSLNRNKLTDYFTCEEQQEIRYNIDSFLQLYSGIDKGYLYLIDDCTGKPIVIPHDDDDKVYPIEIDSPYKVVKDMLSFMQIGMILMRGTKKSINTLIHLLGIQINNQQNHIFQLSAMKQTMIYNALLDLQQDQQKDNPISKEYEYFVEIIPWLSNECYQEHFFNKDLDNNIHIKIIDWSYECSWLHDTIRDYNDIIFEKMNLRPIETICNDNILWSSMEPIAHKQFLSVTSSSLSSRKSYVSIGKELLLQQAALEMKKELILEEDTKEEEMDKCSENKNDEDQNDNVDNEDNHDDIANEENEVHDVDNALENDNDDGNEDQDKTSDQEIKDTTMSEIATKEPPSSMSTSVSSSTSSFSTSSSTSSSSSRHSSKRDSTNESYTDDNELFVTNDIIEDDDYVDTESILNNPDVKQYQISLDVIDRINNLIKKNNKITSDMKEDITEDDFDDTDEFDNESLMNNSTIQRQHKFSSNVNNRLNNIISNLSSRTQTSATSSDYDDELGSALLSTQEQRRCDHMVDSDQNNNQVLRTDQVFRTDSYNVVHIVGAYTTDCNSETSISAPADNITVNSSQHYFSRKSQFTKRPTKSIDDEHYIPSNVIEKLNRLVVSNKQSSHVQQQPQRNSKIRFISQKKKSKQLSSPSPNNRYNRQHKIEQQQRLLSQESMEKMNKLSQLSERNRYVPTIVNIQKNTNHLSSTSSIISGLTTKIDDCSTIKSTTKVNMSFSSTAK